MQQAKDHHTFVCNNTRNLVGLFRCWNERVLTDKTFIWVLIKWPDQHAFHGGPIWAKNKLSCLPLNEQDFTQGTGHDFCQHKIHCGLFGGNSQWAFSK